MITRPEGGEGVVKTGSESGMPCETGHRARAESVDVVNVGDDHILEFLRESMRVQLS